jgi:predicted NBD/HSP70 family sugar kinase
VKKRSAAVVAAVNRSAILQLIGRAGPIARNEIARELGLSPATVTKVTRDLIDGGIVHVVDQAPSRGGRPALLLATVGSAAHALGVKVAPDHVVGVRVDLDARVLERFEEPFDASGADAVGNLERLLLPHVRPRDDAPPLLGVGLGVPGVVGGAGLRVVESQPLSWVGVELGEVLGQRLGVPVLVDNDVNTLVIAERLYGRGRTCNQFATVTIGRGVGLGIIVDGDVYRGARGGAGELGHTVVAPDGPLCECGRRGCLETLVSDPALVRQGREAGILGPADGIAQLRLLARGGDVAAGAIFAAAGATLGRAVAGVVSILDPELVLVSGEGTEAWPLLAESFEAAYGAAAPVEVDPWDDVKWARGGAALVLRATLVPPQEDEPAAGDDSVRERLTAVSDLAGAV